MSSTGRIASRLRLAILAIFEHQEFDVPQVTFHFDAKLVTKRSFEGVRLAGVPTHVIMHLLVYRMVNDYRFSGYGLYLFPQPVLLYSITCPYKKFEST